MRSSTGSRGSSRSVTNILNGAASVGTLDGSIKSGPLTGTASLHNSKLSINSQGSQQSHSSSQRPIQEEAVEIEPTFLEKAKFYTSLCMGEWEDQMTRDSFNRRRFFQAQLQFFQSSLSSS